MRCSSRVASSRYFPAAERKLSALTSSLCEAWSAVMPVTMVEKNPPASDMVRRSSSSELIITSDTISANNYVCGEKGWVWDEVWIWA